MTNTPPVDTDDMGENQNGMLGNTPFNVQQTYAQAEGSVPPPPTGDAVDTSVNQSFVDEAPDLPFDLPGLDTLRRWFHRFLARRRTNHHG